MKASKNPLRTAQLCAALAGMALVTSPLFAQTAATGVLQGRVQHGALGDYLNNARVTIDGTTLAAQTNQFGEYRIADAPAGRVNVTAFYSGLPPQTVAVVIPAGQVAVRDFDLRPAGPGDDTVRLDAFLVTTTREMTGATIATNEQRFAPNLKTVMSAETFGDQSENNVAEFLKLMPAISVDYVAQDARTASIRGMPAHTTIVTKNGNQMASAASSGTSRAFEFEQVSMNNISRIEVNKSLLPDMPAEGIGGTINMVTKSAFERTRPHLSYRGYLNANSTRFSIGETPGPGREPTRKIKPGFDFSYINPLRENLGFTLSLSASRKFNPQFYADRTWDLNRNPSTGVENPNWRQFQVQNGPKYTNRYSGAVTVDWRITPRDVLKIGFSEAYYGAMTTNRNLSINTGANPASFGPTFAQGRTGVGSGSHQNSMREKTGTTWEPDITYIHTGPTWRIEAIGALSHATNYYRDIDNGHFANFSMTMVVPNPSGTGTLAPTIRFDNPNNNYLPDVTAVNGLGQPIDPYNLSNYMLNSANGSRRTSLDLKKTARLNLTRDADLFGHHVKLKTGGDVRESRRDIRRRDYTYTFLGPDLRAGTADNSAAQFIDESFSTEPSLYGLPATFQWPSAYKMWDNYVANPGWWTINEAGAHQTEVQNSKYVVETVKSAFVRVDGGFFRNRLTYAGGVRLQKYDITAESGLIDNTRGAGLTGLALAQARFIERGAVSKSSVGGKFYPSGALTYRLTENLHLRTSYSNSVNYPNLTEVTASTTISEPTIATPLLTVNPTGLTPWFARNYDVDLEYYTPNGGTVTLSVFRKEISNFINQVDYRPADAGWAERVRAHGFDPAEYASYTLREKFNGGEATLRGWEFAVNQSLNEYVPPWARGFTVFFNTSYKAAPRGSSAGDVDAFSLRRFNWGGTFRRGNIGTSLKWSHVPPPKPAQWTGVFDFPNSRTHLDVDVSYRFSRRVVLFASGSNIWNVPQNVYRYSPQTPDYARRKEYHNLGVQMIAGIKGEY